MKFTCHAVSDGHQYNSKTIGWAVAGADRVFMAPFLSQAKDAALAAFPGETGEWSESVEVLQGDEEVLGLGIKTYLLWVQENRPNKLDFLIQEAKKHIMTPEEAEAQRRDFAYGNVKLSNPDVSREMVDVAAEAMKKNG